LNERLLMRIGEEPDISRRALIHGFPKQMAALKENLGTMLKEIFAGSRFETGPLLRGAYFTSGTQEGTPIDRLMGSLARSFQIDAQAMPGAATRGKSYFITDVLKGVAFTEANLAGTNRRAELQRAWLQKGAYAAAAGGAGVLIAAWAFAWFDNRAYIEEVAESTERASALLADLDPRSFDVLAALPALEAVRSIPGGYADRARGGISLGGFGLSQRGKLGDQAVASYRRLLNQQFLSRVMLRLESQLRSRAPSSDYTYEALKAYLMLDSREHYDPITIMAFVREDWNTAYERAVSTEQRAALDAHLDALFEQRPLPLPLPLSEPAIDDARRLVLAMPLEERIYSRLKREFRGNLPGFNLREAAGGPLADLVFVRKSGRPLSEGVPGLFTREGYRQVFVDRSEALTEELASESWILGAEAEIDDDERDRLLARVRELYLDEFADLYSSLLLDVSLAPFTSADEAARLFSVLSRADDSPLLLLLQALARQTALDEQQSDAAGAAGAVANAVQQAQERLRQRFGTTQGAPGSLADALARNAVEQRFRALNALVRSTDGQPRPVDHLLGLLQELYQYLSVVVSEAASGAIPPHVQEQGQRVLQQLRTAAETQPDLFVGELLDAAAARTSALTTGGLRAYLNDLWRSGPLAVCRTAIAGRYPVRPGREQVI